MGSAYKDQAVMKTIIKKKKTTKKIETTDIGDVTSAYGKKVGTTKEEKSTKKIPTTDIGNVADVYGKKVGNYVEVSELPKNKPLLSKQQLEIINKTPIQAIYDNLKENKSPIFFPWTSYWYMSFMNMAYILSLNENDCSSSIELLKETSYPYVYVKGQQTHKYKPNEILIKNAKEIADDIMRCMKQGKVLALPIGVQGSRGRQDGGHANMLLFNYHQKTAEHFEPHGDKYRANWVLDKKTGKYEPQQPLDVDLKTGVAEVNKYLKEYDDGINFKYLSREKVCPITPKGFNGFQLDKQITTPKKYFNFAEGDKATMFVKDPVEVNERQFKGVIIDEIGGYCEMWSLFFIDLRLKTLKEPVAEVMKEMQDLFGQQAKDNSKEFIYLMRGLTAFSWTTLMGLVKSGDISENVLIKGLGASKKITEGTALSKKEAEALSKDIEKSRKKVEEVLGKRLVENWVAFTTGKDRTKEKELKKSKPKPKKKKYDNEISVQIVGTKYWTQKENDKKKKEEEKITPFKYTYASRDMTIQQLQKYVQSLGYTLSRNEITDMKLWFDDPKNYTLYLTLYLPKPDGDWILYYGSIKQKYTIGSIDQRLNMGGAYTKEILDDLEKKKHFTLGKHKKKKSN